MSNYLSCRSAHDRGHLALLRARATVATGPALFPVLRQGHVHLLGSMVDETVIMTATVADHSVVEAHHQETHIALIHVRALARQSGEEIVYLPEGGRRATSAAGPAIDGVRGRGPTQYVPAARARDLLPLGADLAPCRIPLIRDTLGVEVVRELLVEEGEVTAVMISGTAGLDHPEISSCGISYFRFLPPSCMLRKLACKVSSTSIGTCIVYRVYIPSYQRGPNSVTDS